MATQNKSGRISIRKEALRRAADRQPAIPGLELRRLDNIFFAVCPGEAAAIQIHGTAKSISNEIGLGGRMLDKDCLHVTLHGVGEYEGLPRSKIDQAIAAAGSVSMPAFEVGFDRVMSFANSRNHPLVLKEGDGNAGLRQLHGLLGDAMRRAGLWRTVRRSFTPHLTLLYDSRIVVERKVPAVRWAVNEFVLIHSPQGHSCHHRLGRWELTG